MVGNLAQTVRHFGFSETAANKIASALDMVSTKVFSHTTASGARKLWSVLYVECQSKTEKHGGYSIRIVREWHDDEMRRGIQHIKSQRFTKSTNTCQPRRAGSLPPTVLVDDRYYRS
eukprot:jgi/Tetstr1/438373/TSEL_026939.t1